MSNNHLTKFLSLAKDLLFARNRVTKYPILLAVQCCVLLLSFITGTGFASAQTAPSPVAASPTSLSFGSITVNTSNSLNVVIKNTGTSSVSVSGISTSSTVFSASHPALPYVIPAGSSLSISVSFVPVAATSYSGSLQISSNGNPSALSVSLSGTGVALKSTLVCNPTSLAFGDVTTGLKTSLPLVLTVHGTTAVTISSIVSSNSIFLPSSVVLPVTLEPGQLLSLAVSAAPTAVGTVSEHLAIYSNATVDPLVWVPLTVNGISSTQHYVDLAWLKPSSTSLSIKGYNVYRASSPSGPFARINSSLDPSTTYVDGSVSAGKTYFYEIKSSTGSVESSPSNLATVTVPSP